MSAFDNNFAYTLVSSSNRTLKITGVNAAKYSVANANWGAFPVIPALYAGSTPAYNGYGTAENAFSVVEIADDAFNGRTEFAEGPLVLPTTIQRIGDRAFNGVKINGRLTIPASVTYVGANAFASTLIDEIVAENESTSDVLSGVVDLTRITSKEITARVAADTGLNTIKVPKADPEFTGITTIPTAAISAMTVSGTATVQAANVAVASVTNTATVDYYENNVSEKNRNARFRVLTTSGNSLSVGGVNESAGAIEITLSDGTYRTGAELVAALVAKLNAKNIAWVGGETIAWNNTSFDANANAVRLGYATDAPVAMNSPSIAIRTKFTSTSNGVSYDSSSVLGAVGATLASTYEPGAFILAYENRAGLNFPQAINLGTPTLTVNGNATLAGSGTVAGNWNFIGYKPKYNAQALATESFAQSQIQTLESTKLISTASTLSQIVGVFRQNPDFELHAPLSQAALLQSMTNATDARIGAVSTLSSAISGQASATHSTNAVSSAGISTATSVRVSDVASVSASLETAVSTLQSADISMSGVLSDGVSVRNSQSQSLSSAISTAESLLQNADNSLSTGVSSATVVRGLDVSANSAALSAEVSRQQSLDAVRSSELTNATSAREGAVSSIASLITVTAAALEAADTAFGAALAQQTAARVSGVEALSGAVGAPVLATQSMNAVLLPKLSGSATDATTSTVFNLLDIRVGDSLTFVKSGGSAAFSVGDEISIAYSASDHVSGKVTTVSGSNVAFTVAHKATSASETTIYTTGGAQGSSVASSSGSHVVPLSSAFVVGSNYVVTSMTGTLFSSVYTDTGSYRMSLLDASGTVIATSLNDEYYDDSNAPVQHRVHRFNAAFIPKNATNLKQKFAFTGTHSTQVVVNFSDADRPAYTTVKGYAVPYSSGAVLISNGALQRARVSEIGALSSSVSDTMGALSASVVLNQTNLGSNAAARAASIASIISITTQSMTSVQTAVSTHGSVLASAVAQRGTGVLSLSTAIATSVSALSSATASISSALSNQVANRSSQLLAGLNSLVGEAPSSLDTLFEIAAALDAGPALYSTITAVETSEGASGAVASASASLSAAASTLQLTDATLSAGISTALTDRISHVASVSIGASAFISSNRSMQSSVSVGISTTASARQSGVASISTSLSDMASALQLSHSTAGISISTAASVRQSGVADASASLSAAVSGLQSTNAVLSAGISGATSGRQSGTASVSASLSSVGFAQQSHMTSLAESFSTLSNGIVLDALANVSAVDSAINQIVGVNAVAELDALNEIAAAINNNATIATTLDNLVNTKAAASVVETLSSAVLLKVNQTEVTQLVSAVETKANELTATQLQTAVQSMSVLLNGSLSNDVQLLQTNMTANAAIYSQISDAIRQVDTLYEHAGLVNADGSIKYKVNTLNDMVLQSSSLSFTVDANYAITKVAQVVAVQFDAAQTSVSYTSRGIEYPLNPIALTNRMHTFIVESSNTTDYANNATAIVVTAKESALRMAPTNPSFTVPKLALSTYATPTVQTPYAAITWSDATGKISQVITINFESGVQRLQIDETVHDVSGTTEKVVTLEYLPGTNPTSPLTVKALNSTTKLESATLTLTNVYNEYPQHAAPAEVDGSNSVTMLGSQSSTTTTVFDWTSLANGQSKTFKTSNPSLYQIGDSIKITYSASDSITGSVSSISGDNITMTITGVSSNAYTPVGLVSVSNANRGTNPTLKQSGAISFVNPNQVAYGDSYIFTSGSTHVHIPSSSATFNMNLCDVDGNAYGISNSVTVSNGTEYIVMSSYAFSDGAFVPAGQVLYYNITTSPSQEFWYFKYKKSTFVYNDTYTGSLNGYSVPYSQGTINFVADYKRTATYITTASTVDLQTYNVATSTYTSSDVAVVGGQVSISLKYVAEQIGQPLFKLRAKTGNGKRVSDFIIVNAKLMIFSQSVQSSVSYTTLSAGSYRVTATYAVHPSASAVKVINPSTGGTYIASQAASGGNVTFSINYSESQLSNRISFAVITLENQYGYQSVASATQPLTPFDAPSLNTISYSGTGPSIATMTYAVDYGVSAVRVSPVLPTYKRAALLNSALIKSGNLSGVNNGQKGTISIWWEFDTTNGTIWSSRSNFGYGEPCSMFKSGSNINITLRNGNVSGGSSITVGSFSTTTNPISGPGLYHLFASWDLSTGKYHIYINGVAQILSPATGGVTMGQTISYANNVSGSGFGAGMFATPVPQLNGHIGLAYINYAEYVDPTTSINKFITAGGQPVSLGLNGALPTGNIPIVFLNSGNGTNSGTGGDFIPFNAVSQAPVLTSSPTFTVQTNAVDTVSKTASLVVQFADSVLDIVVVALENTIGRESAASASQTLLRQFATPTLSGSISYSDNTATMKYTATMTYTVDYGATAVQVRNALTGAIIKEVNNITSTSVPISLLNLDTTMNIVVVAVGSLAGRESAPSAPQTLFRQFTAPTLSGSITYTEVSAGSYTAAITYAVDPEVTAVQVKNASDTVISESNSNGTTVSLTVPFTNAVSPLNIVIVALGNSAGRAASTTQILLKQFAAPTLSGSITYSGISGNTVSMTYTVDSGVNAVQVRNAADSSVISGTTTSFSGTTATISLELTNTINIVVVALTNASGRESAPSAAQTLVKQFAAPTLSGSITYSGNTATIPYTVDSNVSAVSVFTPYKRAALSTSALIKSGNLSGVNNGPKGTISIWWEFIDTLNGTVWSSRSNMGYGEPCSMYKSGSNINITLRNGNVSGGSSITVGSFSTTTNPISGPGLYHLFASWDLSTGKYHIYINGVAQILSPATGGVTMGQTISYANNVSGSGFGAGMFNPPVPQLNGHIGLAYINYAEYVDPTTSINKFITAGGQPVSLGLNGELPTGNIPIVFLNSGNGTNSGTGGNFESLNAVSQAPVLYSSPPGGGITVQTNTVDTVSKTASLVVQFEDAAAPLDIVVFALGNSVGRVSAVSATRTLLKQFAAPTLSSSITYSGTTATLTYTVASGVAQVQVRKASDNVVIATANVIGTTGTITVPFVDAGPSLDIVAIALGNSNRRESAASATRTLLKQFAAPTLSGSITYSGNTATMTYTADSGVTQVQVRNASNNAVITTGVTTSVSGTSASVSVTLTETISIVVVASGNAVGRDSAASATQTLLKQFAAPLSGSITYSGNSASMTYTVESGVTAVQVRKASDNNPITGATTSVSGTTATITVPFTDADLPFGIVVIAAGNASGRESVVSATQTLLKQFAAPTLSGITYSGNTATIPYTVESGVTQVVLRNASDNAVITTANVTGTITATVTENMNVVLVALGNTVGRESAASATQTLLKQFAAPLSGSITYSGNTATIPYTVGSGVTQVQVRNASDNAVIITGVTTSVSGTSASVSVTLTETISIVVVASGNTVGRESVASVQQTLFVQYAKPQSVPSLRTITQNSSMFELSEYYLAGDAPKLRVFTNDGIQIGSDITTTTTVNSVSYFKAVVTYASTMIGQPVMKVKYMSSGANTKRDSEFADAFIGTYIPTIIQYNADQGDSFNWDTVSFNRLVGNSYTASTTSIPAIEFPNADQLISVVISDSVTSIDRYTFRYCTALTSVVIGNSVTSIGEDAFASCTALTSVVIPNSVTSIDDGAFYECSALTTVVIGNSVTSIGLGAFHECSALTSVSIPDSVTSIGEGAFESCDALTSITVGNNNANYSSLNGVLFNKAQTILIQFPGGKNGSYTIPNSVTLIGEAAFRHANMTSVVISNSVISIGHVAFGFCANMTSVVIGNSVASIGDSAFRDCQNATSIVIGNSVTSIGIGAFRLCTALTSIEIPDSVTSIGSGAFVLSGLATVTIAGNKVISGITIQSPATGVSFFGKTVTTLLKQFAAPTSGSPTYTIVSAGSYTASIPYTVASGVSQVNVVKSSDAMTTYYVVPTAMRQILDGFPSLGAKRTWTFTVNGTLGNINLVAGSMIPLHIDFRSDRTLLSSYNGSAWGPDVLIMSGFHNLARPTTFTVAFDTKTFLIRYDNNTKTAVYLNQQNISLYDINNTPTLQNATYTGPVLTQPTWKMRIAFRSTGAHNSWRAIIGEMRNNIIDRGWGVWISDTNYIHFSWNGPTYNATELTVAQNTDYMLAITKNSTSLTLALTNVSSNTTQSATMTSNMMSANGPVTVGGWIQNNAPEVFVGTISSVVVEPLNIIASAVVSGNTAAITVPFTDADSPLDIVAIALGNAVGRDSAASATQTLLKQFAAPTLSGSITYSGTTASMTYTVASGVTAVQVKNALNNNAITGTTTNVSGTTATITVPFTDANSPLGIVVIAAGNANGRESAASATQTLLKQFAAPTLSGSITYSGTTASMTYTVASGVTAVQVKNALNNNAITGTTTNVSGTTATITVPITNADSPLGIVVIAAGNASGRESAASATQTLLKQFAAPTSGSITYSGNTATIPYTVESGVTQVVLRKASDNAVITTANVTGTTGTITATVTENMNVVLVALGNSVGRESAASATQTLLKQFAAPTSGSPTYTLVSAGSYTASIPYTVASGVSRVNVFKSSDTTTTYSVVPAMVQPLAGFPTLGAKKTWTMTMNSTLGSINLVTVSYMIPLYIDFRSDRVVLSTYNGSAWGPEAHIMSGFHNLARPTTFTVAFDAVNFLIGYDNNTKTAIYPNHQGITSIYGINNTPTLQNATYTGPVIKRAPIWEMRIAFRSTSMNNSWRALIGDMRNSVNERGWGVWISDANNIHFSWNHGGWDASPAMTVAQNTDYVLAITNNYTSLTLSLTNVVANTTQTATNTATASYNMSANGPVTVGGWLNDASENFVGTISSVVVDPPKIAVAEASGTTATITVPFTDADSPLDTVAIAAGNASGRDSVASATQTLLKQFAAPFPQPGGGISGNTATRMYGLEPEITEVRVLQENLTPLPNGTTVTSNIVRGNGYTYVDLVISFTVSPLVVVVVAQANSNGRESVPSATRTLLRQFAAPIFVSSAINPSVQVQNGVLRSDPLALLYNPNEYLPLNMIFRVDSLVSEVQLSFGEPVIYSGVTIMQYTRAPIEVRYYYYGHPTYSPPDPTTVRIIAFFPNGETLYKVYASDNEYGESSAGGLFSYTF